MVVNSCGFNLLDGFVGLANFDEGARGFLSFEQAALKMFDRLRPLVLFAMDITTSVGLAGPRRAWSPRSRQPTTPCCLHSCHSFYFSCFLSARQFCLARTGLKVRCREGKVLAVLGAVGVCLWWWGSCCAVLFGLKIFHFAISNFESSAKEID